MQRDFKGIWIPREIWLTTELTLQEKVFLVEIDSLDNESGCYASNKHFSEVFLLTTQRCSQVIKSLEKKKMITIDYVYKKNSKEIDKRIIKVSRKFSKGIKYSLGGIKEPLKAYQENFKGNNTKDNNTVNNNIVDLEKNDVPFKEILDYLNHQAKKQFKNVQGNKKFIQARWNEGYTLEDFKKVIDNKVSDAENPAVYFDAKYVQPSTLFGNKFDQYLNQVSENSGTTERDYSIPAHMQDSSDWNQDISEDELPF